MNVISGITAPFVDIGYVQEEMKDLFELGGTHCASQVLRHILESLSVEQIPKKIIGKVCSF